MEPPSRIKISSLIAALVLLLTIVAVSVDAEQDHSPEWIRGFNCTDCSECMNFSFYYADCTQLKKIIENNGANLIKSDGFSNSTIIFDEANRRNSPALAWDILGLINTKERNSGCAEKCYLEATKIDGNYSLAWKHLGMILEAKNNLSGARDAYEKAASIDKNDYILFNKLGFVNQLLGKDLIAIDYYNKSLDLKKDQEIVWLNRGIAYQNLGLFTKAIESYQIALKINNSSIKANYYLALCYYQKGEYENATYYFSKSIKDTDNGNEIYKDLIRKLADSLYHQEKYGDSAKKYEILAKEFDPEVIYNLANAYFQNGSYVDAIAKYKEALNANKSLERADYNLGLAYMIQEDYSSAIESFNSFILKTKDNRSESNARAKKAICLAHNGEYCKALDELKMAQYKQPNSFEISAIKGLILAKLGSVDEALRIFEDSINKTKAILDKDTDGNIDRYKYFTFSGKGDILLKKSSNDHNYILEAIDAYDQATKINNDGKGTNWSSSSAWANKGRAQLQLDRNYDAMISFYSAEKNISKETITEQVKIYNGLGDSLYRLGSYNESMNYYNKAKSLSDPTWLLRILAIILAGLGILLLNAFNLTNLNRFEKSIKSLKWDYLEKYFLHNFINLRRWPFIGIAIQFLAFLFIMAYFFTMDILREYVIVAVSLSLLLIFIWSLFGTSTDKFVDKFNHSITEIKLEHKLLINFSILLSIIFYICIFLLYYLLTPDAITRTALYTFRSSLLILLFAGILNNMPILIAMISRNVDNDIRKIISLFQFLWVGLNCLYLFRLLWSYGYINSSYPLSMDLIKLNISISILLPSIFGLFLIAFILPYLWGWRLSKQQRIGLLETQRDILNLYSKMPRNGRRNQKLEDEIKDKLGKTMDDIGKSKIVQEVVMDFSHENYNSNTSKKDMCISIEKLASRQYLDLRFKALYVLCRLRRNLGKGFAVDDPVLEDYQQQITGKLKIEIDSKPEIWLAILSILTPLIGQYIVGFITKTGIASDPSALASSISGILLNIN